MIKKTLAQTTQIRLVYDKKTLAQTTHIKDKHKQLECGPMPNVMVALPNIGGALCSTPQSLADAHY